MRLAIVFFIFLIPCAVLSKNVDLDIEEAGRIDAMMFSSLLVTYGSLGTGDFAGSAVVNVEAV